MKRSLRYMLFSALSLLSVLAAMSACGTVDTPTTDSTPVSGGDSAATSASDTGDVLRDHLPELNFGGETVSILHFGYEPMVGNDSSDWYEDQGDVIADAVYTRDRTTEERLGITLSYTTGSEDWGVYPDDVRKIVMAGEHIYDIIFMETSQCFRLCLDGYFLDISDLKYIDLAQPWWYKEFMDGGAISTDKRYFLTGAFSVSTLEGGSAAIFNKRIYNEYYESVSELYDMAENHTWTYDKFIELCRGVYRDVNGNGTPDEADQYGLFNRGQQTVNYVSMSTGLAYIRRDGDGRPVLDIYNENSARWVEKLHTILYEDNVSYKNKEIDGLTHFANGNALFFLGLLSEYTDEAIRNMEDPYGVLPMPVLDAGMEYMSAAGTVNGQSAVLPTTTDAARQEICGATLESLSIEAYRTVLPTWYEVALKSKYADTERDSDMIDIIYNSIDTSFIMIADKLLGTGSFFYTMIGEKERDPGEFASFYEKQSSGLQKKWDKMLDAFAELES